MADCCIFAGQGAQVPGMGKDFAESDSMLMDLFDKANGVLGFDLKKICFEGPAEELTKSNVCQPAIFVTSYAAFLAFQKCSSVSFAAAAGLSLGEWVRSVRQVFSISIPRSRFSRLVDVSCRRHARRLLQG